MPSDGRALGSRVSLGKLARWSWKTIEHNNILEGRAALSCLQFLLRDAALYGQRVLIFSDNQVVIGMMAKGKYSTRALNFLARWAGAIRLATGIRPYWR